MDRAPAAAEGEEAKPAKKGKAAEKPAEAAAEKPAKAAKKGGKKAKAEE